MFGTFFKPLKNEYRKGLVGFSIVMGVFVKSILIFVDLIVFLALISLEISFILFFVSWPLLTFLILIKL